MRTWLAAIAVAIMMSFPGMAVAAKGVVAYSKSGCDYFIVETNSGYALLEWYGGNDRAKEISWSAITSPMG